MSPRELLKDAEEALEAVEAYFADRVDYDCDGAGSGYPVHYRGNAEARHADAVRQVRDTLRELMRGSR